MDGALQPEQLRALEYLARKGTGASVEVLRRQLREAFSAVEQSFDRVVPGARFHSPAAGKWSPHEILDHLVLSHGPAVAQLDRLLDGVAPSDGAIPADLHRAADERPEWAVLRARLGEIHRELSSLLERAHDELSLEVKVAVEIVVKVDSEAKHWIEHLDWKAFVQGIRMHTLEHNNQLQRTVMALS